MNKMGQITIKKGRKRKPESEKKKTHPVYATDLQWQEIERLAQQANSEVSPYIIKKALG